jgi:hypothetical protein
VEHAVCTLVRQRVRWATKTSTDHDDLRHDPVLAVLVGKLAAKRADCAQVDA